MDKEKVIRKLIDALVKSIREKRITETKLKLAYQFLSPEEIKGIENFAQLFTKRYPDFYKGEKNDSTRIDS